MRAIFGIALVLWLSLGGCMFSNCIKKGVPQSEKVWFKPYNVGQKWIYKSNMERTDTLTVVQLLDTFTACNRFELGDYQFNWIKVGFESYHYGRYIYALYTATESNKITRDFTFLDLSGYYIGNEIDQCLDTIKIGSFTDSLVVYTFNKQTTGDYNYQKIHSFSWSKKHGILRYEAKGGEVFELVEVR